MFNKALTTVWIAEGWRLNLDVEMRGANGF
jgi:hypothetical protein